MCDLVSFLLADNIYMNTRANLNKNDQRMQKHKQTAECEGKRVRKQHDFKHNYVVE